ncbi:MAG: DUF892 family protein [Dehalococcoidales bacterium]|nr:DUF892 family protein [Dehalococcoidales bacterium]
MATEMTNLKALFVFRLNQTISAEKLGQQMTRELAKGAQRSEVKDALQRHESTVNTQISHLEDCMRKVGGQQREVGNYVIEGMMKEVDEFRQQNPPVEAFDIYRLGMLVRVGYLKIADYHLLVEGARALGQNDCASMLESDLHSMEENAKRLRDAVGQSAKDWSGGGGPSIGMR